MHVVRVLVSNICQIIVPTGRQTLVQRVTQVGKLKMVRKRVLNKVPVVLRLRLKKVMEVRVLTVVIVPRVRVEDQIVVVVKEDLVDVLIVIQMVIVPVVAPIITNQVISVMLVVTVKQVLLVRRLLLLVLLLKKVMEVLVLTVVIVPRVRVEDQIVVAVKEDPVDALIVIQMVIVPVAVLIITDLTLSVMPVVVVKQVLLDQHRRLLARHLKKVMDLRVLTVVIVPRVRVVDPIVVAVKEDPADVLIVIQMAIVLVAAPIITNLTLNVMPAVVVKQVLLDPRLLLLVLLLKKVMEVRVLPTVTVLRVHVVVPTVAEVKEDLVGALIVIQMVIVPVAAPIITKQVISVMPAVVVKQVHLDQHRRLLVLHLKKVMEVLVFPTVTVLRVHVVDPTVVAVKEDPVDVLIVIQMVTVQHVVPIITSLIPSVMPVVAVKQVHLDQHLLPLVLHLVHLLQVVAVQLE